MIYSLMRTDLSFIHCFLVPDDLYQSDVLMSLQVPYYGSVNLSFHFNVKFHQRTQQGDPLCKAHSSSFPLQRNINQKTNGKCISSRVLCIGHFLKKHLVFAHLFLYKQQTFSLSQHAALRAHFIACQQGPQRHFDKKISLLLLALADL